jgi:hypothetical protein
MKQICGFRQRNVNIRLAASRPLQIEPASQRRLERQHGAPEIRNFSNYGANLRVSPAKIRPPGSSQVGGSSVAGARPLKGSADLTMRPHALPPCTSRHSSAAGARPPRRASSSTGWGRIASYVPITGQWLDCGCADGSYSVALKDAGAGLVVGTDIEEPRIAEARRRWAGTQA